MDDIEWVIHNLRRNIDTANAMIEASIKYSEDNNIHFHSCANGYCDSNLCAGPSPYWFLKNALEVALQALHDKYPTPPLTELPCKEGKPISPDDN